VSKAVNKIKANQMAGGLPLIESIPEVHAAYYSLHTALLEHY
jgi:hypothetical protein